MSRTWWVRRLFGRRPSFAARPAARPGLVRLEDRTVPTLQLGYVAATGTLSLNEVSAAADNVFVTQPAAGQLRIQLNGVAKFDAGSVTGPLFTYSTAGDPANSSSVVVNVSSAGTLKAFAANGGSGPDLLQIDVPTVSLGKVTVVLSKTTDSVLSVLNAVTTGFDGTSQAVQVASGTLTSTGPNPVRLVSGGSGVFGAVTVSDGSIVTDDGDIVISGHATGLPNGQGVLISGFNSPTGTKGVRTTGAGNISITGVGGDGDFASGVIVGDGAAVESLGTGIISITGTGGGTAATDVVTAGVLVASGGARVTSAGGGITLTGTGGVGNGTDSAGVGIQDTGSVVSAGGPVTFVTDRLDIDTDPADNPPGIGSTPGLGTVNTAGGTVTVRPLTAGTKIALEADDSAGTLGLTAAEFNQVTAGTLVIGDASAGGITLSASLSVPRNLTLVTGAGVSGSGNLANGSATPATVTFDQAGDSTYSGGIGGATANDKNFAVVKQGAGTLTLAGASSYTGATTVAAGTLLVAGMSGTGLATVQSGAILGGTGTVGGGLTVNSGGTLSPGVGGVGTLTVAGNLNLNAGSTFLVDLGPGAASDQVVVPTGSVGIGNGVNLLGPATAPLAATSYKLLSRLSVVDGTGFKDASGTSFPPFSGGPVVIGGQSFRYQYAATGFTLTPLGTTVVLDGAGNLVVTDTRGTDDTLTVRRVGTSLRVSDPNNVLLAGAGTTAVDGHTVDVPLASVTGGVRVDTGAGTDSLTVDYAGGTISPTIAYDGGTQPAGPGDTLIVQGGSFANAVYTPTGPASGTLTHVGGATGTAGTITFAGLEPLTDTTAAATFTINATAAAETINLTDGPVVIGTNTTQVNSGASNTFELVNFANKPTVTLNGAGGADAVTVSYTTAGSAAGLLGLTVSTGTAADTVNILSTPAGVLTTVNTGLGADAVFVGTADTALNPGKLNPVLGAVSVDGGSDGATLTVDGSGASVPANYMVSGTAVTRSLPDPPLFGGVTYANLTSLLLTTGSGPNIVNVAGTSVPTTVSTNAGADAVTVAGVGLAAALTVNTGSEDDAVTFVSSPASPVLVDGGAGNDTLVGPDSGATFTLTGVNAGSTAGGTFVGVENLRGGSGNDTLAFTAGGSLSGTVDGGAGTDSLDYSAVNTSVRVNLGANAPGFAATLEGAQEAPAPQATPATGAVSLTYDVATGTFDIHAHVFNLAPGLVTGYHIHRAPFGVAGPIVMDLAALFGAGALVPDGSGGFTFDALGVSLPGVNEAALLGGITYFNVHTAAAPGGLIRGQLFPTAAFVNVPGVATGTGWVSNVENATGGSAGDSLVGSNLPNVLSGLGGNDTLVGARGNDVVSGGAADDVLVWSNGDNSDVLDGDAGTDLVQVNGAVAAGDVFTVGPNGPRVAFARTNLVPFALDIGTVETLTANGIGGDDTFTAKNLSGVADLTQLNLNGLDGNDTFTVAPSPTVAVRVNGFSPVAPALPGDTLTLDAENNTLSQTPGADASSGTLTAAGRQPVTFVSIETLAAVNVSATLVTGTNGDDTVVLFKTAGGQTVYTFNGGPALPVFGPAFQFDGLAGRDVLRVDYTIGGDPLSGLTKGVTFDGTNKAGDTLVLVGTGGQQATYVADKTESGKGMLSVTDGAATGVVSFRNLSPVDVSNLAKYTVSPAGATNVLLVADGKDFLTNTQSAVVVSGTTDGFAIEPTSARNVLELVIDTVATVGSDTVTLGPVSTDPAVASLTVRTGVGADMVTASSSIGLSANLSIDSKTVNLLSFISVGGSATVANSGILTLSDAAVIASGPIIQIGGPIILAGIESVLFTPFSGISLQGAIDAAVDGTSKLSATANDPAAGVLTLSGSVGITSRPDNLFLTGGKQISLGGATYRTTGDQIFNGSVRVSAPAVGFESAGGVIQFLPNVPGEPVLDATTPGGSAVTVTAAGGVTFGGEVGTLGAPTSLTVGGGTTRFVGGRVRTVGDQTYQSPVEVAGDIVFRPVTAADPAITGSGTVKFDQSLTTAAGVFVLVVTFGPVAFFGPVSAGSLTVAGDGVDLGGGTVTTTGPQTYTGASFGQVVLSADAVLTGSQVVFERPLVSLPAPTGPYGLVVNGAAEFQQGIGEGFGLAPLRELTVNGSTRVSRVRTYGDQTYNGPVTATFNGTEFFTVAFPSGTLPGTGKITINGSLDGPNPVSVFTDGDVRFGGPVGATVPLASLQVSGSVPGNNTLFVGGGLVSTTGSQFYSPNVVLNNQPAVPGGITATEFLMSGSVGSLTFFTRLDAATAGVQGATVRGGDTIGLPAVGGLVPLAFLAAEARLVYLSGDVNTTGGQAYGGRAFAVADVTLTATNPRPIGGVTFLGTLDASTAGQAGATVNTPGGGATRFDGAVGGTGALKYLRTDASGLTLVRGGLVRTVGDQFYADPMTVTGGSTTFDTVLAPSFAAVGTGPVTFAGTLNGGAGVLVRTSGDTTFGDSVGGTVPLAGLATDGGGTTRVNGGLVRTTNDQVYTDAVQIGADTQFAAGGSVLFGSTLDGPFAATVTAAGATTFGGPVGGTTPLASLTTDGGGSTVVNGGLVSTIGSQSFADDVSLGSDALFTSAAAGAVTFAGRLDAAAISAQGARVATAGVTAFGGPVGGLRPLAFLTADSGGTTVVAGGLVQTTGPQNYVDPVSAPNDVTFQTVDVLTGTAPGSGAINFFASLTAGGTVTVCTLGPVVFLGGVNAGGLVVGCAGMAGGPIDLNGGSITTAGPQTYFSDVELSADTYLSAPAVTFGGRLDTDGKSNWRLTVAGAAAFAGEVGGLRPLGRLDVTGTATVGGGLVRTTDQPNAAFPGSGSQNYGGPVSVSRSTLFEAVGSKAGAVRFLGTLDATLSDFGVTVTTAGLTEFAGSVGGTGPLGSLTVDGGGETVVRGTVVRTVRGQTFLDAVRLDGVAVAFTSLAGGDIRFAARLDSLPLTNAFVTLATDGTIRFEAAVGKLMPLLTLTTTGSGTTLVSGGDVFTVGAGGQRYGQPVRLATDTTFTSSGEVNFDSRLDAATPGGASATVNTFFLTRFAGPVGSENPLSRLTTDDPGFVFFAGGLVRTTGDQTYLDPAVTQTGTQFVSDGGTVRFGQTLDGPGDVVVAAPATAFGGAVGSSTAPGVVQAGPGPIAVGGGLVRAATAVRFGGPVAVTADTTFATTAATEGVSFSGPLSGTGKAVVVNTAGRTAFGGDVAVGSLATDAPGATSVATPNVTAAGAVDFGDRVDLSNNPVTVRGGSVRFRQVVSGPGVELTVLSPGVTRFDGPAVLLSLATDAPGTTELNGGSVSTTAGQTYGDPVTLLQNTRFDTGGSVTFQRSLTGPVDAVLNVASETVFNGAVNVGSLATDAPGLTRVNGGGVTTTGGQQFGDAVRVDGQQAMFAAGGAVSFISTLDGPQSATVTSASDTLLGANVGADAPLASLTLNGGGRTVLRGSSVQTTGDQDYGDKVATVGQGAVLLSGRDITLRDDFAAGQRLRVFATGSLTQTGGAATARELIVSASKDVTLDQVGNDFDTLSASVSGDLRLSDADDLTLDSTGVSSAGKFVRLRTGGDFTAAETSFVQLAAGGQLVVYPGLNSTPAGGATVRYAAVTRGGQVVLGRPTEAADLPPVATPVLPLPGEPVSPTGAGFKADANTGRDTFIVRPVAGTPIFVYGNEPRTVPGDRLLPDFAGRAVVQFAYDGKDGFYVLSDGAVLRFSSIESLSGLSLAAFVVQTGEPRDASGATSQQYAVRAVRTQNGTVLTGGLKGARLPENPFVVSPALVNPAAPTQSPRLAFGDFNGDNVPDLVLANGPGTPPLVTVIDGKAVDLLPDGTLSDIATLQTRNLILAQFYAYDPGFQGGVNVAVGNLGGGGLTIVTGADEGGGPHVRSFRLVQQTGQANPLGAVPVNNPFASFYGYEAAFGGGVRVAVADVTGDGKDDLVLVPGAGGGPRVRVYDGAAVLAANTPLSREAASYADFFTVEESFRGGLYVAAGMYRSGAKQADIIVGAAGGGGPRVMIFAGDTVRQAKPTVLADFFAFTSGEQSDPLFGQAGYYTGVGGVSFGGRGGSGFLDVLVSTGRGPQLTVRQFDGGPNLTAATPTRSDLTDAPANLIPLLVDVNGVRLDPDRLNYGATVGGFVDPGL